MLADGAITLLRDTHPELFANIHAPKLPEVVPAAEPLLAKIKRRLETVHRHVITAIEENPVAIEDSVEQLALWMDDRAIVRILGAGRARLAAAIPANRLAHGGAHVYLQDSFVPMPHSLHGGGIIAASASGKTPSVLSALNQARQRNKDIRIIGLAAVDARRFHEACDISIGMPLVGSREPLSALADIEEYAISELLDALVVAAGQRLGFTDATWRLGHEDLGPATGPYDHGVHAE